MCQTSVNLTPCCIKTQQQEQCGWKKKVEKQSRGEVGGKIGNVLGFFHTIPPIL